jgi:hypothetical protein
MDGAPRVPVGVEVVTDLSVSDAAEKLRDFVEAHASIEDGTGGAQRRSLTGTIAGANVDLSVRPPGKGFQVVFHGSLDPRAPGALLRGTIDIADHRQLRVFLFVLAAVGVLLIPMTIALQVRDLADGVPFAWEPVALAAGIAALTVFGVRRLTVDIEQAAAVDARLLAAFLGRSLGAARSEPNSFAARDIAAR